MHSILAGEWSPKDLPACPMRRHAASISDLQGLQVHACLPPVPKCRMLSLLSCAGAVADTPNPATGESPMATLGRIRSFAPTAAKLANSKDEYLSVIKTRRQEEAAARKDREVGWPG